MEMKSNRKSISHYISKLKLVEDLYSKKKLVVSYDRLSNKKKVDYELLYFNLKDEERKGIFIFGYDYFIKEMKDQEMKKILGQNFLNSRIHNAYSQLVKKGKGNALVSINEIVTKLVTENPDLSSSRNRILTRILNLAYYHGWDMKRDEKGIDNDYFVTIPDSFRKGLKQRFNLDKMYTFIDDLEYLVFVNLKGDLIFVFKNKNDFVAKDVEVEVFNFLEKEFEIKDIEVH